MKMIKQLKTPAGDIINIKDILKTRFKYRWEGSINWTTAFRNYDEYVCDKLRRGWKDVTSATISGQLDALKQLHAAVDPNDFQPAVTNTVPTNGCPHVYDIPTDTCKLCNKGWNEILWDTKPCCGGVNTSGPHYYSKGAWHDSNCDTLKPPTQAQLSSPQNTQQPEDYRPQGSKKGLCTCGSAAVGSDRHSSWCDTK